MIRKLLVAFLAILSADHGWADSAVGIPDKRAETTQTPDLIDDTNYFGAGGPMIDRVTTRDTDNFKRDITRVGMILHYTSPYEFFAVGASNNVFRQDGWSAEVTSLLAAVRNINRRTAEGVTGRLAVTTNAKKIAWHGEGTLNVRFNEHTGMELIGSRDAVETVSALREGILSNFLGVSVDHAVTDRFTVIGMPTYRRFTDGNSQQGWRGWLIYSLMPDWGLGAEMKVQAYDSTGDSRGRYFSPENYERREAGLRLRRALGSWRVFVSATAGQERINHDIEKPTRTVVMTAQQTFDNNLTVGAQFSYFQASNSGTDLNSSDDYAWRMGRIYMAIPF